MAQSFGELLRSYRLAAGFGLRRFAAMVDLKASNLSDIEHGRRNPVDDPVKLSEITEALGLVDGSEECQRLYDAARRPGGLPPDLRHMADRQMVPALLRTIDNLQLDDAAISRLIEEIGSRAEGATHAG